MFHYNFQYFGSYRQNREKCVSLHLVQYQPRGEVLRVSRVMKWPDRPAFLSCQIAISVDQPRLFLLITRFRERIPIEHIETKNSSHSKLQIGSICSIRILSISSRKIKKTYQYHGPNYHTRPLLPIVDLI